MRTFIINLERSHVRRAHIIAEAERCGLNYELFPAVDGSKLTDEELGKFCDIEAIAKCPEWLTPGMIGCALSHYFVYDRIVEDDIDVAFVLEDDMVLPEDMIALLDQIKERIIDGEIVTLHYFGLEGCSLSSQDVEELGGGRSLYFPMNPAEPITTGGYVITNLAAQSMLEVIRPVRAAPDSWGFFYEMGECTRFGVYIRFRCALMERKAISIANRSGGG